MPKDFTRCVSSKGSHMVTIKPREDVYIPVCYDKKGNSHAGETHHLTKTKKKK